jgi:hypothetical protein
MPRKDADDRIPQDRVSPTVPRFHQSHSITHDDAPYLNAIAGRLLLNHQKGISTAVPDGCQLPTASGRSEGLPEPTIGE